MRIYKVVVPAVTVSAAQDFVTIYSATVTAGKMARLLRIELSATDTTIPTSQMMEVQVNLLTGTVTAGSVGSAATITTNPGDQAATYTARKNDTTPATATVTTAYWDGGFHVYNGLDKDFTSDASNPLADQPIVVGALAAGSAGSAAIQIKLPTAPTGTLHLAGTITFGEAG